jgi:hypothetical protein
MMGAEGYCSASQKSDMFMSALISAGMQVFLAFWRRVRSSEFSVTFVSRVAYPIMQHDFHR